MPISSKIKIKTGDNTYQEINPINTWDDVYIDDVKLSSKFNADGSVFYGNSSESNIAAAQFNTYPLENYTTELVVNATGAETFSLSINKIDNSDMYIDWGDGNVNSYNFIGSGAPTHSYDHDGEYKISIICDTNSFNFGNYCLGSPENDTSLVNIAFDKNFISDTLMASFNGCSNLSSIVIPEGITTINLAAFDNCFSLTNITLPEGLISIRDYTFRNCTSLSNIIIPDSVTNIGIGIFLNCTSLSSVILPESVTSIGNSVFYNCTSLSSVILPESVTNIGDGMFTNCSSLVNVILPESISRIGNNTFNGCSSLLNVEIPESVTTIGNQAFNRCYSLLSIVIPEGVISIENSVFYNCTSLSSVILPETVISIGSASFYNCTSLSSITIPEGVTSIEPSTFYNCRSLSSITIPETVISIEDNAFNSCVWLSNITIPESVTSVGNRSFANCTQLISAYFEGDAPTSFGTEVFRNTHSSFRIYYNDYRTGWTTPTWNGYPCYPFGPETSLNITTANANTSITLNIDKVDDSNMYVYWGDGSYDIYNFTGAGTPTHIYTQIDEYDIIIISNMETFYFNNYCLGNSTNNGLLNTIIFGENYGTIIGNSVFYKCINMTTITLPDHITVINDNSFFNCTSLANIILPSEGLISIGSRAFSGCTSLIDITIPEGVNTIYYAAFYNCNLLTNIIIPESVTTIEGSAFKGCASLSSIYFNGDIPITFGATVFTNTHSSFRIYYNDYRTGWTTPTWNGYPCYPVARKTLDEYTWEEISAISASGRASEYFNIGDCKAVHVQGTVGTIDVDDTYYVFILGFDHNSEIEGTGISFGTFKTARTNGIDIALVDSEYDATYLNDTKYFNMNHNNIHENIGGWQGCDLRYDILGSVDVNDAQNASSTTATNPVPNTLMAALPSDLRSVMKPITKYTDNYGNNNNNDPTKVTTTIDYLPLLSEYEIFGTKTWANDAEQTYQQQYEYYRLGNNTIKYSYVNNQLNVRWWTRSNRYDSSTFFSLVNYTGYISYSGSGKDSGLMSIILI